MFRLIKALMTLALIALVGLVAYAYLGDLAPAQDDFSLPVELNVAQ